MEVKAGNKVLKELSLTTFRINGKIATLRHARKTHTCKQCALPIPKGTDYYEVVFGPGGLGDHKFPDRFHIECLKINEGG